MLGYFVSSIDLWTMIATPNAPRIVDVRRSEVYDAALHLIPGAVWRDAGSALQWAPDFDRAQPLVLACKAGHQLSQMAAAQLRAEGWTAHVLEDGYEGWAAAGLPFVAKRAIERLAPNRPSLWVTRRRPKLDRVACPWLVRRFVDPQARFLFVDAPEVENTARECGAIPFDIQGVELGHEGERCTFDTMLRLFGLEQEPSLARLALIVRGADTARHDLAPEAAGLHAVALGFSTLAGDDDHALLRQGFPVYDALFAWLRFAAEQRHNWPAKAA
jgi:rhodanese-related sulfurtransferase